MQFVFVGPGALGYETFGIEALGYETFWPKALGYTTYGTLGLRGARVRLMFPTLADS